MASSKTKSALSKTAGEGKKIGIVVSQYHEELTRELVEGAVQTLQSTGVIKEDIVTVWVPGAFEIPLAARAMSQHALDAILCLGIIIKGETTHDQYIAREVARGVAQLSQTGGMPVIFGVLTTQTTEQAKARCGGDKGNKGAEAAEAALAMLQTLEIIKKLPIKQSKGVGF